MSDEVEGIVLYEDFIEGRPYLGIFCKKYPTREINVFVDDETREFAKPGRYVFLSFSRSFHRQKPNLVMDMDMVGIRQCGQTIDHTPVDKKFRQVLFREQVFFAKDNLEHKLVGDPRVFGAAYSPEFGWVLMLQKHLKEARCINPDKAYNVVIANPPKRLSQSLIEELGSFMFCVDIGDEIADPKVYKFLNEVAPIKRNFGDVAAPECFTEALPLTVLSMEGDAIQLVFVYQKVSEGLYKAFDVHQNQLVELKSERRLEIGNLYLVEVDDTTGEISYYNVDHANSMLSPLKDSFEFEAEANISKFDCDDLDAFIWKAYADTIFGTVLLVDVPEEHQPDDLYTIRAVFSPDDVEGYVWYAHRYSHPSEDEFRMVSKFTARVAEILKDYEKHSLLPSTPDREFDETLKNEEVDESAQVSDAGNRSDSAKLDIPDSAISEKKDKMTTEIKDEVFSEPAEENSNNEKEEIFAEEDHVFEVAPRDDADETALETTEYKSSPEDVDRDHTDNFCANNGSSKRTESQEAVRLCFLVLEAHDGYLLTFSPEHKYGLVTGRLASPELFIGKWIEADCFLIPDHAKYSFLGNNFCGFGIPKYETLVVNRPNDLFVIIRTRVSSGLRGIVDLSDTSIFSQDGHLAYLRYIGGQEWGIFDDFEAACDYIPDCQPFVSPDFKTSNSSFCVDSLTGKNAPEIETMGDGGDLTKKTITDIDEVNKDDLSSEEESLADSIHSDDICESNGILLQQDLDNKLESRTQVLHKAEDKVIVMKSNDKPDIIPINDNAKNQGSQEKPTEDFRDNLQKSPIQGTMDVLTRGRARICEIDTDTEDDDAELDDEIEGEDSDNGQGNKENDFFVPPEPINPAVEHKFNNFVREKDDENEEEAPITPKISQPSSSSNGCDISDRKEEERLEKERESPEEKPRTPWDEAENMNFDFGLMSPPEDVEDEEVVPWGDIGCNFVAPTTSGHDLLPLRFHSRAEKTIYDTTQINQVDSDNEEVYGEDEDDNEDYSSGCEDFSFNVGEPKDEEDIENEKAEDSAEGGQTNPCLYSMPPDGGECFENSSQDLSEDDSD
ncbi:unnamed protein product [Bursaphelenchus xylophilus]|uniref:(pine wood nematode) hypothetical protein n=1 Tax=Bursaphelenchus xylophilus TaxID=6326 RepID=A0A1I7RN78_BURXY|nr:unnamed protein product [Bursaphelenchus xylophilus]CAG9123731.1 unnamed protein product [Bursaphelenchus xylophilus]